MDNQNSMNNKVELSNSDTELKKIQEQSCQIQDLRWNYENSNILSGNIDKLIDLQNHLQDLNIYKDNVKRLEAEDEDLERIIFNKENAIEEDVETVIKKRRAELGSTYDSQIDNIKADIKKVKAKREKRKSKKVSERILDETADLRRENSLLKEDIKKTMKSGCVPRIFNTKLFHALYYPTGFADLLIDLICVIILFFILPNIVFRFILRTDKTFVITIIYLLFIVGFGTIYLFINTNVKNRYHETLTKVKEFRSKINDNIKGINKIKKSVQKDKDESNYGLEKFNKELVELEEAIEDIHNKKRAALDEYDKNSKMVLANEIREKNRPELENLQQKHEEVHTLSKEYSGKVKDLEMQLASSYETYLGKEFMNLDKLEKLINIMQSQDGMVVSDALKKYQEQINNE